MFTAQEAMIKHSVPPFDVMVTLGELYSRARRITNVIRSSNLPWHARGTFTQNVRDQSLNCITLAPGKEAAEEVIILAHELGHAENCKYEPARWNALQGTLQHMALGYRPPYGFGLLIEEEILANDRGRRHLQEICPSIVDEFNRQMQMSLLALVTRLGSMR
jgi:hypothetical protein